VKFRLHFEDQDTYADCSIGGADVLRRCGALNHGQEDCTEWAQVPGGTHIQLLSNESVNVLATTKRRPKKTNQRTGDTNIVKRTTRECFCGIKPARVRRKSISQTSESGAAQRPRENLPQVRAHCCTIFIIGETDLVYISTTHAAQRDELLVCFRPKHNFSFGIDVSQSVLDCYIRLVQRHVFSYRKTFGITSLLATCLPGPLIAMIWSYPGFACHHRSLVENCSERKKYFNQSIC
jgi:hypothetical protein